MTQPATPEAAAALGRGAAFIFFTREVGPRNKEQISEIYRQTTGHCKLVLLSFVTAGSAGQEFSVRHFPEVPHIVVRARELEAEFSGYPKKYRSEGWSFWPENIDLAIIAGVRRLPYFQEYWLMEDDVVFSGDLARIVDHFAGSTADLICTNVRRPPARWVPGRSLVRGEPDQGLEPLAGFMPFCRMSHRGFQAIDEAYRKGWSGHYEIAWPTILKNARLDVEDFGGDGSYVQPANLNRFYRSTPSAIDFGPGTFVYYPPKRRAGPAPDLLWHPVKDPGSWLRHHWEYAKRRAWGVYWGARWYASRLRARFITSSPSA